MKDFVLEVYPKVHNLIESEMIVQKVCDMSYLAISGRGLARDCLGLADKYWTCCCVYWHVVSPNIEMIWRVGSVESLFH